jgi:hypothetical protein
VPRPWAPSAREARKLKAQLAKGQDEHGDFRARSRRQPEVPAEKAGQLLDRRNDLKRELSRAQDQIEAPRTGLAKVGRKPTPPTGPPPP